MAKAAKRLFICLDNAGYEVSLERLKIYVALQDAKAVRAGYLRIIDDPGRTTCTLANASSRRNSQSRPGARSSRVTHNIRIPMRYFSCEYAISTQGLLALMASTRSGILWL
jgi:hypothetical protein